MVDPSGSNRRWFHILASCCGFWGVSAVLGGIALVSGILPIPTSLLDGTPFPSYTIPGIALIAVGIGSLTCGIALIAVGNGLRTGSNARSRRHRRIVFAAGAVGVAQLVFLAVELLTIGFSWLLAIYAMIAVATMTIALTLGRQANGRKHGPQHGADHRPTA